MQSDEWKRRDAIRALINIVVFEGLLLISVIGVYFYTDSLTYLIVGIAGVILISGPMFLRWVFRHASMLKSSANREADR